jgi:hypothetical protein
VTEQNIGLTWLADDLVGGVFSIKRDKVIVDAEISGFV